MQTITASVRQGSPDPHVVRHSENEFDAHDEQLILRLATSSSSTVCPIDYCKNNGQCTFDYSLNRLRCACPSTFTGQFCEVPIGRAGVSYCSCQPKPTIVLCLLQVNRTPAPVSPVPTAVAARRLAPPFSAPAKVPTLVHNAYRRMQVDGYVRSARTASPSI